MHEASLCGAVAVVALESAHVHHVVALLRHARHHIESLSQGRRFVPSPLRVLQHVLKEHHYWPSLFLHQGEWAAPAGGGERP